MPKSRPISHHHIHSISQVKKVEQFKPSLSRRHLGASPVCVCWHFLLKRITCANYHRARISSKEWKDVNQEWGEGGRNTLTPDRHKMIQLVIYELLLFRFNSFQTICLPHHLQTTVFCANCQASQPSPPTHHIGKGLIQRIGILQSMKEKTKKETCDPPQRAAATNGILLPSPSDSINVAGLHSPLLR